MKKTYTKNFLIDTGEYILRYDKEYILRYDKWVPLSRQD